MLKLVAFSLVVMPALLHAGSEKALLGEWEVVSQTPSQKELSVYAMKLMGVPEEYIKLASSAQPETDMNQKVTFTKDEIIWESKTESQTAFGNSAGKSASHMKYQLKAPNKLVVNSEEMLQEELKELKKELSAEEKKQVELVKKLMPEYFTYKVSGNKLTITTSKVEAYEGKQVVYELKRVK